MDDYQPSFTITNDILTYVSSILEKIGCIMVMSHLKSKSYLKKDNHIKSIYSFFKIEASPLALRQVGDVINGMIVLEEKRGIREVKNASAAYEKFAKINPYDINYLKKVPWNQDKYVV